MANDGEVKIGTKVDESGLDKGLKNVKNKVNSTQKDLGNGTKGLNALKTAFNETGGAASGLANKLGGVATSGGGVAVAITAAVMAAKKYIETLKKANEAYKVQEKSEKALTKAAENNPYLNGEGVERLKAYAGELQKESNYGDEKTIDIMAQLAGTGRTEAEIIKIMGAAADYAAATHTDLASAAQALNATYSGMSGTLGRQIDGIKDLTAEQLKNGDAIDLVAQKYKGFAAEAVDSSTQSKNAFGDFMESVGKIANPMFEGINQLAKSFWESMTEQMNKFSDALETASRKWAIGGIHRAVNEGVDAINKIYINSNTGEEKSGARIQTTGYLQWLKEELELRGDLTSKEKSALIQITAELKYRERVAREEQELAEAEAKRNAENKKALEIQATTDDYAKKSNQKLKEYG